MEPNQSASPDWKTCFKKILAPHLLNPSNCEEQNDVPNSSNSTDSEEQNDADQNIANPNNYGISTTAFRNNPKIMKAAQKIQSSIMVDDTEDPIETDENVAKEIAAHAEKLAKSFMALKIKKKDKYFYNKAENSRNPPDWNSAFKKVLDPKSVPESLFETPEECVDKKPYLSHPELLDSWETNPWTYHRLCKDEDLNDIKEVPAQPSSENSNKERHYTKEEKEALQILRQARTFKRKPRPKKTQMNIFDGAGVNCFKDSDINSPRKNSSSKPEKPKNVPPPGGWVCIKPLTIEETRKRPINVIVDECWDWDEDY